MIVFQKKKEKKKGISITLIAPSYSGLNFLNLLNLDNGEALRLRREWTKLSSSHLI
jgi:hypothetical protein